MCSFGSCKMRFEFLSQFRKVQNAFECFVTQVQTHLPKTKRVWPMKINVICTVQWFLHYTVELVFRGTPMRGHSLISGHFVRTVSSPSYQGICIEGTPVL